MLGDIPYRELVTSCIIFMETCPNDFSLFYSTEDKYHNKKVFEFTVSNVKKGEDETAGESNQNIRTANPYS